MILNKYKNALKEKPSISISNVIYYRYICRNKLKKKMELPHLGQLPRIHENGQTANCQRSSHSVPRRETIKQDCYSRQ
jgi:hypothetical protein